MRNCLTQIVDKNRLQCNIFNKSVKKNMLKIANSWRRRPPKFTKFLANSDAFFQMPIIGFGQLNFPMHRSKKSYQNSMRSYNGKIEAGQKLNLEVAWAMNLQFTKMHFIAVYFSQRSELSDVRTPDSSKVHTWENRFIQKITKTVPLKSMKSTGLFLWFFGWTN